MMMYLPKSRGGKNVFLIFKLSTMDLSRRVFAIQYVIMYASFESRVYLMSLMRCTISLLFHGLWVYFVKTGQSARNPTPCSVVVVCSTFSVQIHIWVLKLHFSTQNYVIPLLTKCSISFLSPLNRFCLCCFVWEQKKI